MPLADDASGTPKGPGQGFAPLFMDPTAGTVPNIAPDPDPGPLGGAILDTTDWTDNNLGDNPRFLFRPAPPHLGAVIIDTNGWFFDQFWIVPRPVDYVNILSAKTITVGVLNTFRYVDQQLTSIDESGLAVFGVTITKGPARPATLLRSQQITFDFQAALDGVASFDELIDFTFDPLP